MENDTKYGELDITVNLSKPRKIRRQSRQPNWQSRAVIRNASYARKMKAMPDVSTIPARNHRIIPITVNDSQWGFHIRRITMSTASCSTVHTPMKIERATFVKLFDFAKLFPHYFLVQCGSADRRRFDFKCDHFQGGHYVCERKAPIEQKFEMEGFEDGKPESLNGRCQFCGPVPRIRTA